MPRPKKTNPAAPNAGDAIASLKYPAKRKNIPPAGLEAQGVLQETPRLRYDYNPHLPPVLRSATEAAEADKLPELLATARKRALTEEEARTLAAALRRHEPWLEWSGKREKPWFEVEPVALHMHERISTQAILRVLAREDVERDLFADPQHDYAKAVQFYQHDVDWANRMILGDSLQVMASLARREDLAGRVQMIYLDPPYGIKFASNFQPQLGQRDVKDREQDLTREPEMVKAYRDTWTLGIHSYLAYLRDRLQMARELLTDSGSIFVQISDENLHRVRCVMDEVFGPENFVSVISFKTTTTGSGGLLASVNDFLLWYAKDKASVKFIPVHQTKEREPDNIYKYLEFPDEHELTLNVTHHDQFEELQNQARLFSMDNITSSRPAGDGDVKSYRFRERDFALTKGTFKSDQQGLKRLERANRLGVTGSTVRYKRFFDDFAVKPFGNIWTDTSTGSFTDSKIYAVQTGTKIVERCLLMTTDPGDLVLDPTCGSGTTAYVAEQWGRRWITCDSSRVALALAKHRLMTAKFDYQQLRPLSAARSRWKASSPWKTARTRRLAVHRTNWRPSTATRRCRTPRRIWTRSSACSRSAAWISLATKI